MTRALYRNGLYLDETFRQRHHQATRRHDGGRVLMAFLLGVSIGVAGIGIAWVMVVVGAQLLQRVGVL